MSMISESQMQEMYDAVAAYINGAPPLAIKLAIKNTAKEFIRETGCLTVDATMEYDKDEANCWFLISPCGGRVDHVNTVRVMSTGRRIDPVRYKFIGNSPTGVPMLKMVAPIAPIAEDDRLVANVGIVATDDMDELPDAWYEAHKEEIISGTIAWLCAQAGKPWFNETIAAQFMQQYRSQMVDSMYETRLQAASGNTLSAYDETAPWITS